MVWYVNVTSKNALESVKMDYFGYASLVFMGFTLGLVGAGGSILTIPILVYLFKIPILIATSYSQVIVGGSAFVGVLRTKNAILFKKALLFSIPSMFGVFISRYYVLPHLPESIGFLSRDHFLLLLLIIFMLTSAYLILRDYQISTADDSVLDSKAIQVILVGFAVGLFMGLLGAGGGFLIIPTLVILMGIPMHQAVPTSLFITALNALMGSLSDQVHLSHEDWTSLVYYLSLAVLGMAVGVGLSQSLKPEKLKRAFGVLLLIVAITIVLKEFVR